MAALLLKAWWWVFSCLRHHFFPSHGRKVDGIYRRGGGGVSPSEMVVESLITGQCAGLCASTRDKTLNLRFSETVAMKEKRHGHVRSSSAMGRRSPSTSLSVLKRKRQKIPLLKKNVMANKSSSWSRGWRAKFRVEIEFTSWRQSKFARTSGHSRQEGDEMERGYKTFYEASLQIKDKKASWQMSLRKGRKEKTSWYNTTDSGSVGRNQQRQRKKKKNLKIASTLVFGVVMKPKWPQEPKSIINEELKQCFARYKESWEPVEKKTEVVAEKAWQSSRSSNTKSQHLEQDLESLVDLVKEKTAGTDKEEMTSLSGQQGNKRQMSHSKFTKKKGWDWLHRPLEAV